MSNKKPRKNVFLRRGVRSVLSAQADKLGMRSNRGPSVPCLLRAIAERRWSRPHVKNRPIKTLSAGPLENESQAGVELETYYALATLSKELGFDSIQEMLEDFAAEAWD